MLCCVYSPVFHTNENPGHRVLMVCANKSSSSGVAVCVCVCVCFIFCVVVLHVLKKY